MELPIENHDYCTTSGPCGNRNEFLADYGERLEDLKQGLLLLPANVQREMIIYLFERTSTFFSRETLIDSNFKPLWSPLYSKLRSASYDFSRLLAGDKSEEEYCYEFGLYRRRVAINTEESNELENDINDLD